VRFFCGAMGTTTSIGTKPIPPKTIGPRIKDEANRGAFRMNGTATLVTTSLGEYLHSIVRLLSSWTPEF